MFRFSLQTALEVRERQEKVKQKDFAEAKSIEQQIQQRIDDLDLQIAKAREQLNQNKLAGIFSLDQMRFQDAFEARIESEKLIMHQRLSEARKLVDEKRELLIQASRATKTLEILREKEQKKYWEKVAREEQKQLDEIAGNAFIMNN